VAASGGFSTGLPLGDGRLIPVDYDALTTYSLSASQPNFIGALGTYDATGHYGGYHLVIPNLPALTGIGFDLIAVTLDPAASNGIEEISVPHHVSLAGHATNLSLTDDGSANVAIGFAFPFYGQTYTQCWINANGNVTFGAASSEYVESAGALIAGPPRIAMFWDDLNPAAGGLVRYRYAGSQFIVEWAGVPEFNVVNGNNAILVLNSDGTIEMRYFTCGLQDAVVGIGPGAVGGAALSPWNLSDGFFQSMAPANTIHEVFDGIGSTFDLALVFTPFSFLERRNVIFRPVSAVPGVVYRMTVDL
jgi:hypothetical protein